MDRRSEFCKRRCSGGVAVFEAGLDRSLEGNWLVIGS